MPIDLNAIMAAIQHLLAQAGINVDQHTLGAFIGGLVVGTYMSHGRSIHKKGSSVIRSLLPF